ncbi:MAG: hypothetical protein HYR55_01480 [Acidobacteria bacterium]|nr:hypothetical protein [Acidobacteriota bacterium]MBI3656003.1 hypothetical protein [Acidobacteriota bacterium]
MKNRTACGSGRVSRDGQAKAGFHPVARGGANTCVGLLIFIQIKWLAFLSTAFAFVGVIGGSGSNRNEKYGDPYETWLTSRLAVPA